MLITLEERLVFYNGIYSECVRHEDNVIYLVSIVGDQYKGGIVSFKITNSGEVNEHYNHIEVVKVGNQYWPCPDNCKECVENLECQSNRSMFETPCGKVGDDTGESGSGDGNSGSGSGDGDM